MTRQQFRELVASRVVLLDGATGTELVKRGMPGGVCPESWVLEHPDAARHVQHAYRDAGSDIIYAPTFGGNRLKLAEFGLEGRLVEINRRLAEITVANLPGKLVFGDLAPTGQFIEPIGELGFEDAVAIYREQVEALLAGGVQGFAIETMLDLQEARAALLAVRECCDLPAIVTMTFDANGRTLTGCDAAAALVTLQSLGADAFGCNCSTGPENMLPILRELKRYARIPLVAKPNAGMPKLVEMKTVFDLGPADFARQTAEIVAAGANIVGGCCGTTPEHIRALAEAVRSIRPLPSAPEFPAAVAASRVVRALDRTAPFALIGERINPTGKKALQAELREGRFELVRDFALDQTERGAALLDVNCGCPGVDEPVLLRQLVSEISMCCPTPLCIDTTSPEAAEKALRLYPGRALFNSISAETNRLENVLPVAAKYGAMLVVLPLTDTGIPATLAGRIAALDRILAECAKYGIGPQDCCVDALVMTASANPEAPQLTLDFIDYAANQRGLNTVCGLSNVSFGLPRRELVNAAFLGMAIGRGLNMAIANPAAPQLLETIHAGDVLTGRDRKMATYLACYGNTRPEAAPRAHAELTLEEKVAKTILEGDADQVESALRQALAAGRTPRELIDDTLIPAITEVGSRYEKQIYFLPQLVQSAGAMQQAMHVLLPLLADGADATAAKPKIVLATVKGDIHDIGKNIVALMLRNYGFEVFDLGKDVPADTILDAAAETGAKLVGLSALMTTTMVEMDQVIRRAAERGQDQLKFIVGGAVLSEEYAERIGANYAADALATVKIAQSILGITLDK